MLIMGKQYWGFRISKNHIDYLQKELEAGRLRQGWGWQDGQNLRERKINDGSFRNISIFEKVKKGDILLVPRLPSWGEVAICEAVEDFDKGYIFRRDNEWGDFGHIFPAKMIKSFVRHNESITGNIRSTLKNPSRFWNINHFASDIEKVLSSSDSLLQGQSFENRAQDSINSVFATFFKENDFSNEIFNKLNNEFQSAEWENLLVFGLRKLFPNYVIEATGGRKEKEHGTDILIKIPGIIPDFQYAIAIQVKDYDWIVSGNVKEQINKAEYWGNQENLKLIDKIVIITKATREQNKSLVEEEKFKSDRGIKFIFSDELKEILLSLGKAVIKENF